MEKDKEKEVMRDILKWLETQNAQKIISDLAFSVIKSIFSKNMWCSSLDSNTNPSEFLEDIRSELILFILEKHLAIQELYIENQIPYNYIKIAFINAWIGKNRKPRRDMQRYLYKHTADVLRNSNAFYLFSGSNIPLRFSMVPDAVPIPGLTLEDMEDIEFPNQFVESMTYESINKKSVLIQLATYFWQKISKIWDNMPVQVHLKDFIAWIRIYISLNPPRQLKLFPDDKEAFAGHKNTPEDIYFDPVLVKKWACHFANMLHPKEKNVFLLRYGYGLRLKDIANHLGYKGSSGPKYSLEKTKHKLRFFLCDLPWLSPDDLHKEAFALFYHTLIQCLSNEDQPL